MIPTTPSQARKLGEAERLAYATTCPQARGPQDLSYLGIVAPVRPSQPYPRRGSDEWHAALNRVGSSIPIGWDASDYFALTGDA